ncbi:MAG: hypothetical protein MJK10_09250 [Pseudomonadales bacterium]|nr:hypothetical protein [Pseudomonadales bacterium]NRA16230.1 hypothetical protein [Oceanospirillaceae bacterium]
MPEKLKDKDIQDALHMCFDFLKICNGFLPQDFAENMSLDKFFLLVGFQFGAFSQAAQQFDISIEDATELFPVILETINGLSENEASQTAEKIANLISSGYPPIEIGRDAMAAFNGAEDDSIRAKAAQKIQLLIDNYSQSS